MTPPLPPEGRAPLHAKDLRQKARDIVTEVLKGGGAAGPGAVPPASAAATQLWWRRHRTRVLSVLLGTLLIGAAAQALFRAGLFRSGHRVPAELVGVWRTSTPPYADRALKITETSIAFDTGGASYAVYPIREVAVAPGPATTLYTIAYGAPDEAVAEIAFYYVPGREGIIRFKNQRQLVWTRAKP